MSAPVQGLIVGRRSSSLTGASAQHSREPAGTAGKKGYEQRDQTDKTALISAADC